MFIQRTMVSNIIRSVDRGFLTADMAMLWLTAYVFLLRVPSEALPVTKGTDEDRGNQATIFLDEESCVCIRLRRRKNRPGGSLIRRRCTCAACPGICPVHVLWHKFVAQLPLGAQPWMNVSAGAARTRLRAVLAQLQVRSVHLGLAGILSGLVEVPNAALYGTHDFRRGHAKVCVVRRSVLSSTGCAPCLIGPSGVRSAPGDDTSCWGVAQPRMCIMCIIQLPSLL